jgi:hypothetical protein
MVLNGMDCNGFSPYLAVTTTMPTADNNAQHIEIKVLFGKREKFFHAESQQGMRTGYFLSMPRTAYWLFFTQFGILES